MTSVSGAAYAGPGAHIPQDTLTALDVAGERARETGVRQAADLLTEVRPLVDGVVVVFRDDKETAGVLSGARRACDVGEPDVGVARPSGRRRLAT
ncbi:hypothetical protein ACFY3M_27610 [Streptomyces mirabilis]|uniref:hypothetical protein n=1 Tax=Streptomyces mirabilis TaxID=68239 RepID=UPI00369DB723